MEWGTMEAVVNRLGGMDGVQRFLAGKVDCDVRPVVPMGWEVIKHQKGGLLGLEFNKIAQTIELWQSERQKGDGVISIDDLHQELELAGKIVLNANPLDYLLRDVYLIPEEWKDGDKKIFFPGTVYRDTKGLDVVRYLCSDGTWRWGSSWVGGGMNCRHFTAILAKHTNAAE